MANNNNKKEKLEDRFEQGLKEKGIKNEKVLSKLKNKFHEIGDHFIERSGVGIDTVLVCLIATSVQLKLYTFNELFETGTKSTVITAMVQYLVNTGNKYFPYTREELLEICIEYKGVIEEMLTTTGSYRYNLTEAQSEGIIRRSDANMILKDRTGLTGARTIM